MIRQRTGSGSTALDGIVRVNGKTLLIIAHRLHSAAEADRILVLHHGELVEDGTHRQLAAKEGLYARLWRLQTDGLPPS